ncbi:TIGR03862 family flavoprotein [Poseidonocella sedimentorum]|uniref:TIGR03862 family flavoprotein n=1 Tax=Poseidonocella sedimentorum TaxID=871652 RepID=A0A1I6CPU4_9RHOB|nr:TIGR03862 family flavoprotein [Poseidonocella sedimentorum]SFQ95200.1 hypothetical protein SAMN04515673_101169 [Poseidonocella sedimentorum]
MTQALVIGGGPAGLMAAEVMAQDGLSVIVAEAMPTVGRKLLMAGKSGLNLTKEEPRESFLAAFHPLPAPLHRALEDFDSAAVQRWAEGLGQPVFTGSTGRVFPKAMKASPLLRAWLARLRDGGVEIRTRWRWTGWEAGRFSFITPDGPAVLTPQVCVMALGGASWSRLGSDGAWRGLFDANGLASAPFAPANAGLRVAWTEHMRKHFGTPLKNIALRAGPLRSRGEIVLSERGLEGGGIYAVFRAVREGHPLVVDTLPDLSADEVRARLERPRGKSSLANHLRKRLTLTPAAIALAREFGTLPSAPDTLAQHLKALTIRHDGPRPMDEAISTAGGLAFAGVDDTLMLKGRPGCFVAGEMLDWEAPTGGYLLTACLATGRHAGKNAARFAKGGGK